VLIFAALAFGYLSNDDDSEGDVVGWLIVAAVASVIAALLLMRFLPATESDPDGANKPARRALILSVLTVVTIAIFWTGLPFALGVPALALAATGRARAPGGSSRAGDCRRPRGVRDRARDRGLYHLLRPNTWWPTPGSSGSAGGQLLWRSAPRRGLILGCVTG